MKSINIFEILLNSLSYIKQEWKVLGIFSAINYLIVVSAIYSWSTLTFLFLMVSAYAFWSYFFRFYFDKKPYFLLKPILGSLVPSTKILLIVIVFGTVLNLLPYIPMITAFMGINGAWQESYQSFLLNYVQEGKMLDFVLTIIFTLVSPYILYRPFLAWISAVVGRSGSIKNAFAKSRGNYWQFVAIIAILNVAYIGLQELGDVLSLPMPVFMIVGSLLFMYSNIVFIKSYEFLFND